MTEPLSVMLTSKPVSVRLYEDRAEVTRDATGELKSGRAWYAIAQLSPFVDDRSVRARSLNGNAKLISARVVRQVIEEGEIARADQDALKNKVRSMISARVAAQRSQARESARLARAEALFSQWLAGLCRLPPLNDESQRAQWAAAQAALLKEADTALEERLSRSQEAEDAQEALEALQKSWIEAQTGSPRVQARIELQLESEGAPAQLEVSYRVPCALWRPEHTARLSQDQSRVDFQSYAVMWQSTGETWDDVALEFSTARPAKAARAPVLSDDKLVSRKKTAHERRHVDLELNEEAVALAGAEGAAKVSQMPGVDDGGEPLLYTTQQRVTVPSDGQPLRVPIGAFHSDVKVERVLVPERSLVAHLRARGQLNAEGPLLAGPVHLGRGQSLIGRNQIEFVGAGAPFELGFGPDDALRARRVVNEERDRTPVIGTQKLERSVSLYLSNLSGETKSFLLQERIPVSEIEDVEIQLLGADGWSHDERDGFLERSVRLEPMGRQTLEYKYEIRAKSNVNLPF